MTTFTQAPAPLRAAIKFAALLVSDTQEQAHDLFHAFVTGCDHPDRSRLASVLQTEMARAANSPSDGATQAQG